MNKDEYISLKKGWPLTRESVLQSCLGRCCICARTGYAASLPRHSTTTTIDYFRKRAAPPYTVNLFAPREQLFLFRWRRIKREYAAEVGPCWACQRPRIQRSWEEVSRSATNRHWCDRELRRNPNRRQSNEKLYRTQLEMARQRTGPVPRCRQIHRCQGVLWNTRRRGQLRFGSYRRLPEMRNADFTRNRKCRVQPLFQNCQDATFWLTEN